MDDDISYPRGEGFRHQEIIDAPAYSPFPGTQSVGTPGVLDAVRVQVPVCIHETMVEEFLHPGPFLRQKAGVPFVCPGMSQVDRHVSGVEIPGNDDIFPTGVQPVAQGEQVSIEVQLVVEVLPAALAGREVNVEQAETSVERGDEASLS